MKIKSINKIIYTALTAILLATLAIASLFIPNIKSTSYGVTLASTEPASNIVEVTATDRSNESLNPENASLEYDGIGCSSYYWKNIQYLTIKYKKDGSVSIPPIEIQDSDDKYSYTITMQMVRKRVEDGGSFELGSEGSEGLKPKTLASGSVKTEDDLSTISVDYYIDQFKEDQEQNNSQDYGWGIYRFCLTINNKEYYSRFIYIKPSEINVEPRITAQAVTSTTGLNNAWDFSIENYDQYVDDSRIVWFVIGEDTDGKNYAYGKEEINVLPDFPQEKNFINLNDGAARTGRTFHFEASMHGVGEIQGNWKIYCVIYETPYDANEIATLHEVYRSDIKEFSNIRNIPKQNILWVIGIAAGVLLIIVIIIIASSIKKEKVW